MAPLSNLGRKQAYQCFLFRKNTYFTPHYQVDFWREVSFSEAGGKRWKMEGLLPYTKYKFRPICQFSPSFNPIKAFPSSDVVTTLPGGIPSPPHISSVLQVLKGFKRQLQRNDNRHCRRYRSLLSLFYLDCIVQVYTTVWQASSIWQLLMG